MDSGFRCELHTCRPTCTCCPKILLRLNVEDELLLQRSGQTTLDDSSTFHASADEFSAAVLLRVFTMATPVLGDYVTERMKRRYGERRWLFEAAESMGRSRLRVRLQKNPHQLRRDIYLVTEILLNKLNSVFLADAVDIDGVKFRGVLLQNTANEVDCVGKTRTALFHGFRLSVGEVVRCLRCLERLWRRFCLREMQGGSSENFTPSLEVVQQLRQPHGDTSRSHAYGCSITAAIHQSPGASSKSPLTSMEEISTMDARLLCSSDVKRILLLRAFNCLQLKLAGLVKQESDSRNRDFQWWVRLYDDSRKSKEVFGGSTEQMNLSLELLKIISPLRRLMKLRNCFAHGEDISLKETSDCLELTMKVVDKLPSTHSLCESDEKELHWLLRNLLVVYNNTKGVTKLSEWMESPIFANISSPSTEKSNMARIFLSYPRQIIGRDQLISDIKSFFSYSRTNSSHCRLLLHGPHGIGKTSVVRATAAQLRDIFPQQHYFQASTEPSLLADIRLFLSSYGYSDCSRKTFHKVLIKSHECFLLIFDDVREPEMVMSLLPDTVEHCVVFTSVCELMWVEKKFVPNKVISLAVPPLSSSDSFNLFEQALVERNKKDLLAEITTNNTAKNSICIFLEETLLGLPLAVRLAAHQFVLGKLKITDQGVLVKQTKDAGDARTSSDELAAGRVHVRGFYHVVRIGLESIRSDRSAVLLCFALSVLSPNGVPFWLVVHLSFYSKLPWPDIVRSVQVLMEVGLIILPQAEKLVVMHAAVQFHVRQELSLYVMQEENSCDPTTKLKVPRTTSELVCNLLVDFFTNKTICLESTPTKCFYNASPGGVRSSESRSVNVQDKTSLLESSPLYSLSRIVDLCKAISCFIDHASTLSLDWISHFRCLQCLGWCCLQLDHFDWGKTLATATELCLKNCPSFSARSLLQLWKNPQLRMTSLLYHANPFSPVDSLTCATIIEICERQPTAISWLFEDGIVQTFAMDKGFAFDLAKQLLPFVPRCLKEFSRTLEEALLESVMSIGRFQLVVENIIDAYHTLLAAFNAWLPLREGCSIRWHRCIVNFALTVVSSLSKHGSLNRAIFLCEIAFTILLLVWDVFPMPSLVLTVCLMAIDEIQVGILCRLSGIPESDPCYLESCAEVIFLEAKWLGRIVFTASTDFPQHNTFIHVRGILKTLANILLGVHTLPQVFHSFVRDVITESLLTYLMQGSDTASRILWSYMLLNLLTQHCSGKLSHENVILCLSGNYQHLNSCSCNTKSRTRDVYFVTNFLQCLDVENKKCLLAGLSTALVSIFNKYHHTTDLFPKMPNRERERLKTGLKYLLNSKHNHSLLFKHFLHWISSALEPPDRGFGNQAEMLAVFADS